MRGRPVLLIHHGWVWHEPTRQYRGHYQPLLRLPRAGGDLSTGEISGGGGTSGGGGMDAVGPDFRVVQRAGPEQRVVEEPRADVVMDLSLQQSSPMGGGGAGDVVSSESDEEIDESGGDESDDVVRELEQRLAALKRERELWRRVNLLKRDDSVETLTVLSRRTYPARLSVFRTRVSGGSVAGDEPGPKIRTLVPLTMPLKQSSPPGSVPQPVLAAALRVCGGRAALPAWLALSTGYPAR